MCVEVSCNLQQQCAAPIMRHPNAHATAFQLWGYDCMHSHSTLTQEGHSQSPIMRHLKAHAPAVVGWMLYAQHAHASVPGAGPPKNHVCHPAAVIMHAELGANKRLLAALCRLHYDQIVSGRCNKPNSLQPMQQVRIPAADATSRIPSSRCNKVCRVSTSVKLVQCAHCSSAAS